MLRTFLLGTALILYGLTAHAINIGQNNVVSGGCNELKERIARSGVTDAGGSHPGHPGNTHATVEPEVPRYKYSFRPGADGEVCASSSLKAKLKIVSVSTRLDWQPSSKFADSCRRPRKAWISKIESHEADHVRDNRRLESEFNRGVKTKRYEVCDSSKEGAVDKLQKQIAADVAAATDQLASKIEKAAEDYHNAHGAGVEAPNCCRTEEETYCPCNNPAQGKPRNYTTESECAVNCPSGLACFATQCTVPPQ